MSGPYLTIDHDYHNPTKPWRVRVETCSGRRLQQWYESKHEAEMVMDVLDSYLASFIKTAEWKLERAAKRLFSMAGVRSGAGAQKDAAD